jgi:hypothetical protein
MAGEVTRDGIERGVVIYSNQSKLHILKDLSTLFVRVRTSNDHYL